MCRGATRKLGASGDNFVYLWIKWWTLSYIYTNRSCCFCLYNYSL